MHGQAVSIIFHDIEKLLIYLSTKDKIDLPIMMGFFFFTFSHLFLVQGPIIFNRPGVAGPFLQTLSILVN